jgi:phospholipid/cholesterol/gamma-HCH transport system ATP-binding protein
VVFQRNALFSGTVFDNIALWLREVKRMDDDDILPIAERALRSVGFNAPGPVMSKDRDELSGGMAKRVAVARAIAMNPVLMFFDEPTTGLDPTLTRQIHELIQATHDSSPDQTTVIITHDKDLLYRLQPRVIMLHDGRVFFDGSYAAFEQSDSEIIQPYFDLMPGLQGRRVDDR